MDHLAPLPRDSVVRVANRTEGEQLRKAKEDKKRKKQRSYERGNEGRTLIAMMTTTMETMMRLSMVSSGTSWRTRMR